MTKPKIHWPIMRLLRVFSVQHRKQTSTAFPGSIPRQNNHIPSIILLKISPSQLLHHFTNLHSSPLMSGWWSYTRFSFQYQNYDYIFFQGNMLFIYEKSVRIVRSHCLWAKPQHTCDDSGCMSQAAGSMQYESIGLDAHNSQFRCRRLWVIK